MSVPLRIHPDAEAEFAEAIGWYETHGGVDLALDFATAVDEGLESIRQHPLRYAVVHKDTRRILIRRFPYGIFYVTNSSEVRVTAIYHLSRDPAGWQSRS